MNYSKTKKMCLMAAMVAMVMVAVMCLQIPIPAVGGYVHPGDGIIFITVIILGTKYGIAAGALGACIADIITGYALWGPFSFVIKAVMALVCGKIAEKDSSSKYISPIKIIGIAAGICVSVTGYYLVGAMFVGSFQAALPSIPSDFIQGGIGMAVYCAFSTALMSHKKVLGIKKQKL